MIGIQKLLKIHFLLYGAKKVCGQFLLISEKAK